MPGELDNDRTTKLPQAWTAPCHTWMAENRLLLVQIVKDEGGLLGAGGVDNRGVEVELVDCLQRAKGEHLPDIH